MTSLNTTPPNSSDFYVFNLTTQREATLHVPAGCKNAYKQIECWKNFYNIQDDAVTGIDATLMNSGEKTIKEVHDLGGKQLSQPQRGLNIVKMSDGTTKKVVVTK